MKQFWLANMLQDGTDGSISSKRVVTFLAFILCSVAFVANLFWQLKIEAFIFESMSYIAMAGLGATVAEKFSAKSYGQTGFNGLSGFQQPTPSFQPPTATTKVHGTPIPKQQEPLL